jgi:hypothetical protein
LDAARGAASTYLDQARRGVSPLRALESAATAGGLTVAQLAKTFIDDYAKMRELRALRKYEQAIAVHFVPHLGGRSRGSVDPRACSQGAELVT